MREVKMKYTNDLKQLKKNLASEELKFFEKYEKSIYNLFNDLGTIGAVKTAFTNEQADRLTKFRITLNNSSFLHRNVIRFTELTEKERGKIISFMKNWEFEITELGNQMFTIIAHNYHNHLEDLKIHLELLIDFELICEHLHKRLPTFKSLKWMVDRLKEISSNNSFLNYLDNKVRNSIAHFTFYYHIGYIYFCDGIFDNDPIRMDLPKFMIESKNMNILGPCT